MIIIFKDGIQVAKIIDSENIKYGALYGRATDYKERVVAPWEWHMRYLEPLNNPEYSDFELIFVP